MDALPWLILAGIGLVLLFVPIPKQLRNREKPKRFKKHPTSGAFLGVINEIFQPSASNASVIVEEQKVASKANHSADDKPNKKTPVN